MLLDVVRGTREERRPLFGPSRANFSSVWGRKGSATTKMRPIYLYDRYDIQVRIQYKCSRPNSKRYSAFVRSQSWDLHSLSVKNSRAGLGRAFLDMECTQTRHAVVLMFRLSAVLPPNNDLPPFFHFFSVCFNSLELEELLKDSTSILHLLLPCW